MKNLLNLEGVKALSKMEQKIVFGGTMAYSVYAKCCWDDNPNNCSSCELTDGGCISGAHLVHC